MSDPTPRHYLAQCNISRLLAPLDSPQIEPFVAQLARINALAEAAPGFIWRLKTPAGDATSIRIFDDPLIIINLSVWESIDALMAFTYRTDHAQVMRGRTDWFERHTSPSLALWWVPADGPMPDAAEIRARLDHLKAHGPSSVAFTFQERYAPPG